jgi:hypothetical protein
MVHVKVRACPTHQRPGRSAGPHGHHLQNRRCKPGRPALACLLLASCLPLACFLLAFCLPLVCLLLASCLPLVCLLLASCLLESCLLLASCLPSACLLLACCLPLCSLLFHPFIARSYTGVLEMYGNHRNCVVQRCGEKAVCPHLISNFHNYAVFNFIRSCACKNIPKTCVGSYGVHHFS